MSKSFRERLEARHPGALRLLGVEGDQSIATKYGLSREGVRQWRVELGVPRAPSTARPPPHVSRLNKKLADIALEFGVSIGTAKRWRRVVGGVYRPERVADNFWKYVNRSGPTQQGMGTCCWVWTRGCGRAGYGSFYDGERTVSTHRHSYTISVGPIPDGLYVLHRCDNPPCVNPAHLWVGTAGDNARDREAKGRGGNKGRTPSLTARLLCAKLTMSDIIEIQDALSAGETPTNISRRFGVHAVSVRRIRDRKTWKDVRPEWVFVARSAQ